MTTAKLAQAFSYHPIFFSCPNQLVVPSVTMRVTITTLSGVEVARPEIDATHEVGDLLTLLPNQAGVGCSRRLFFGNTELMGFTRPSDIGVKEGSVLTLVFEASLRVLTASEDCTAKVWSADSGVCLLTLKGHGNFVCSAVFSPDCQQVLTASWDQTAKLWSAASGKCLLTLNGHDDWVFTAVFSSSWRAGADCFFGPHREGMVGSFGRVPPRRCRFCCLFRRRPAGATGL